MEPQVLKKLELKEHKRLLLLVLLRSKLKLMLKLLPQRLKEVLQPKSLQEILVLLPFKRPKKTVK
jgi:hypothetical protein